MLEAKSSLSRLARQLGCELKEEEMVNGLQFKSPHKFHRLVVSSYLFPCHFFFLFSLTVIYILKKLFL